MGKFLKLILALALSTFMCVSVSADILEGKSAPDVKTDYYMIVESPEGGIDIYAQPDLESEKLNGEQIPNGTALHIYGETEDSDGKRTWGYTDYKDMNGYVPLDDCRPADSRQEAIDSELYLAGRDNVDYNADYDVTASSEGGTQSLYQGPGKKYEAVPGVRDIKNGETLHITEDADMPDGSHWGKTSVDGTEGWIDLEQTEEWKKEHPEETAEGSETASAEAAGASGAVDMTPAAEKAGTGAAETEASVEAEKAGSPAAAEASSVDAAAISGVTGSPTPVPSTTAKVTAEPKSTAAPTPTVTPKPTDIPAPTATPEPTETPIPTDTPVPTETPEPTATAAAAETPEPTETAEASEKDGEEAAEQASSDASKTTASKWYASPFAWIIGIAVIAVCGILIYHYKKR